MTEVAEYYGFHPNRQGYIQCPFHNEKTGSLKIYSGDKTGWHCFGCGKGGSVVDFVMQLFNLSFPQAVVRLDADFRLGLTAERPSPGERSKILAERRLASARARKEREEYYRVAREHRYWREVEKYFSPTREEWNAGYVHPLYMKALRRLPELEDYLDRNLMETTR